MEDDEDDEDEDKSAGPLLLLLLLVLPLLVGALEGPDNGSPATSPCLRNHARISSSPS